MAVVIERRYCDAIHPLHAVLLAGGVPLYLGVALCDWAYMASFHIQWSNFASWLIVGGLILTAVTLVFALVDLLRPRRRGRGIAAYFVVLLATWVVGFFNALLHARDAWAVMPGGMILSLVTLLLSIAAVWLAFPTSRMGDPV
ncbi:DUF2231 domain-containing protein [Yanghanlia caeni]|uniref:DUF2231 domain-containing protein n=1 Tax=Yanghanlia caeni TaxID=3064283 RepID=A0ABU1D8N1_9BURK|nr:DUF2231 domain-containing protein [Alcaligenaceae bacterium LG-2]NGR07878.1 hypothetical protein [bacterium SGD-2]HZH55617.1 DUF2231 domain-containing protein [Burkholderiaceae bacterium]